MKFIITLLLSTMLIYPAYSAEFDYAQTQKRISVQEEFGDYITGIREKISKNWAPPDVLESGHASVVFKLDKNGNLMSSYIKESSGNLLYDEAALRSVRNSAPYKEFPQNVSRDNISMMYSFDSSLVSTKVVKELVAQSEKYVNSDKQKARSILDKAIKTIEGEPSSYFLFARRYKLDKALGDMESAKTDLKRCKELKTAYDKRRIAKCKEALLKEETSFAYFTLANAYDLAGDYQNALKNIDKAISMTELNNAYIRYRSEIVARNSQ